MGGGGVECDEIMLAEVWAELGNILLTYCHNPNHNLNTTSTAVGFDTIMTVHTPPTPPTTTQELYLSNTQHTGQCNLTISLTILLDYL